MTVVSEYRLKINGCVETMRFVFFALNKYFSFNIRCKPRKLSSWFLTINCALTNNLSVALAPDQHFRDPIFATNLLQIDGQLYTVYLVTPTLKQNEYFKRMQTLF